MAVTALTACSGSPSQPADTIAPRVTALSPEDGAVGVALDEVVTITFSEEVRADTVGVAVQAGDVPVEGALVVEGATATFTPGALLPEASEIRVTVQGGFRDLAGNEGVSVSATFTTIRSAPTVVSTTPADGAHNVPGNAAVSVVFSEAMDPATFTAETFIVRVQGGADVAGAYAWDARTRTATFEPDTAWPGGAVIEVHLTTGIRDISGIPLGADTRVGFTIANAPSVTASSPPPNAVDVPLSAPIELTFSEPMDTSTLTSAHVWIEDAQQQRLAARYVPGATSVTLTPQAPLEESSVYTVVVTPNVTSATGVPFAATYRFSFTTLGIPPTVTSVPLYLP